MRKNYLLTTTFFFQVCFSITSFAQGSNFKENYSEYLPEIRSLNKFLLNDPQTKSLFFVSTTEGLAKSRKIMNSYAAVGKTILQPTSFSITVPGRNIPLVIFKPDTIGAVVLDIHGG